MILQLRGEFRCVESVPLDAESYGECNRLGFRRHLDGSFNKI
jgi:hypothetical protein